VVVVVRGWLGACVGVCVCACVRGWICVCMSTMHGVCCDDEDREGWLGWVGLVGLVVVCVWMWVCVGVMWLVGWWLVVGGWVGGWWVVRSNSNSTQLSVRIHCVLYYCCWLVGSLLSVSVVSFLFPYISHTYTHTHVCVCVCGCSIVHSLSLSLSFARERHTRD
jgi:hypothetical protein